MKTKYSILALTALVIIALGAAVLVASSAKAANTAYYVDCSAATNGSGTQASPWNNLATVNGTTFGAGDQILFKRGATCVGQLWPKGSGVSGNPITVSAYGTGARPIINGNNAVSAVVTIKDQSYWTFDSLEIENSTGNGIFVNGSSGASLYGFTLTNLYVHNGGLGDGMQLVLLGLYQNHSVHDVLVDNVESAYGWRGIETGGPSPLAGSARSSNIIIRNANVHDVNSDGILMASSNNAVTENTVVSNTGIMTTLINHTPNGLWTWDCDDCVVQYNEVYTSHSPSWDGGAFDIDYLNHRNTVQYNYAHDNDAYCFAVFGGDGSDVTTTNVLRYNICSNDARDGSLADNRNGAIYMSVWSRGSVQDTYIYNNTVYYNPAGTHSAINIVNMRGSAINNTNIYNNIIYSASANLVKIAAFTAQTHLDYNLYWFTGTGNPSFVWGGTTYTSFAAWKTGSAQDAHSLFVNPMLNDPTYHANGKPVTSFTLQSGSPAINAGADLVALGKVTSMGARDFFGNAIPNGAYDIGAYEAGGAPQPTATPTNTTVPPTVTHTPTAGPSPTPTNTPVVPTPTNTPAGCFGTTNIALNKATTTTSVQGTDVGANAVDGNTGTRWWTLKSNPLTSEAIVVDLNSSQSLCKVTVLQGTDRYATTYTIQVSPDNVNWTTVATKSGSVGGTDTFTFGAVSGRYVKMNSTAWKYTTDHLKLYEFQMFQP